jgi:hypothetical protein
LPKYQPSSAQFSKNFLGFFRYRQIKRMISKVFGVLMTCCLALASSPSASAESIDQSWVVPVLPDKSGLIHLMNPYRQPNSDYSAGHRGVDYRVEIGQPVIAASAGVVAFNRAVVDRQLVTIRHRGDYVTEYEPVCSNLQVGQEVAVGTVIGSICEPRPGYVWHCLPSCLHFSLRMSGLYLSPLALIGGLAPSRLLAMGSGGGYD